jgi:hypothetical protein
VNFNVAVQASKLSSEAPVDTTKKIMEDVDHQAETLSMEALRKELDVHLKNARRLLAEFDTFLSLSRQRLLKERMSQFEYRPFRNGIISEIEAIERLESVDSREVLAIASQCRNVVFFDAIWRIAQRYHGVIGIRTRSSHVDVEAEGGALWIKVSALTQRRIIFELAEQGWSLSDSESEDEEDLKANGEKEIPSASIGKMVSKLLKESADQNSVVSQERTLRIIFTRLRPGPKYINSILDQIRARGIEVEFEDLLDPKEYSNLVNPDDTAPSPEKFEHMIFDEFERFTDTLNLDCTVLLAMISDIWYETSLHISMPVLIIL